MTYNEFISAIIKERGQWGIQNNEYYEAHHILPRCLGGLPDTNVHNSKHQNIIWLYPQEHYEAHKLLAIENPHNAALVFAWVAISHLSVGGRPGNIMISAEDYAKLAELDAIHKSQLYSSTGNPNYGNYCTDEQRQHFSEIYKASLGVKNSPRFLGHHHSEESKLKIRQKLTGQFWVTNEIIEILLPNGTVIPDGFKPGRLLSTESIARQKFFANKHLDCRPGVVKQVYCIELQKDFYSIAEAAKTLQINGSKISACCHGKRNTAGGYHWQFKNIDTIRMIKCLETEKIYSTLSEAEADTGANKSKICECCNGKRKTAGKYHWVYVEVEVK